MAREQRSGARDCLLRQSEAIEPEGVYRTADLCSAAVDRICWDTLTRACERDAADEPGDAWDPRPIPALRQRGPPKAGRDGHPQVVVGVARPRAGLPVRAGVFPGNTAAVTTLDPRKDDLRGGRWNRGLWVGESGLVSAAHRPRRSRALGRYLRAGPLRLGPAVPRAVRSRPGRYRDGAPNLRVTEV